MRRRLANDRGWQEGERTHQRDPTEPRGVRGPQHVRRVVDPDDAKNHPEHWRYEDAVPIARRALGVLVVTICRRALPDRGVRLTWGPTRWQRGRHAALRCRFLRASPVAQKRASSGCNGRDGRETRTLSFCSCSDLASVAFVSNRVNSSLYARAITARRPKCARRGETGVLPPRDHVVLNLPSPPRLRHSTRVRAATATAHAFARWRSPR